MATVKYCPDQSKTSQMRELLRTNDLVKISWIKALLADADIEVVVLDAHMSVLEGTLGILPRRVMVSEDQYLQACRIMDQAGEERGDP